MKIKFRFLKFSISIRAIGMALLLSSCANNTHAAETTKLIDYDGYKVSADQYETCESDAFFSFAVAMQYFEFSKPKKISNHDFDRIVEESAPGSLNTEKPLLNKLYTKEIDSASAYAAERYMQCTEKNKLPKTKDFNAIEKCFSGQTLYYWAFLGRESNIPAKQITQNYLKNLEMNIPRSEVEPVIQSIVDKIYAHPDSDEEMIKYKRDTFRECLNLSSFPYEI